MTGAAALAALAPAMTVPVAWAQQGAPTPAPTPAPRSSPSIITLPGANQFDLRPSGSQPARATPTPAPTPARATPTPAPAAPARATPTPAPTRQPAATPTPAARATPAPQPAPTTPVAAPQPSPTPAASPGPLPGVTPLPVPAPAATSAPVPVEQGGVPWFWILLGAAMAVVLVALGWLLGRRRRPEPEAEPEVEPQPFAASPPPPAPVPPRPAPAPPPAVRLATPPAPPEPVAVELRPIAIELADTGAMLEFELTIGNATTAPMEGLRVAHGVLSANEMQDDLIASFHASQLPPVADPFDLAPRAGIRIPGRVPLIPERINIVTVGGRPMFVPILLVDIRWRSGLSLRHQASDFMIGIGGQGEKLGPIWLDKGAQRHTRLNANRYVRRPVKAAAE